MIDELTFNNSSVSLLVLTNLICDGHGRDIGHFHEKNVNAFSESLRILV